MSKEQTGIAGEFWFFSQLHRLGYEAYITFGNTKRVDISVKLSDGRFLTFDVKSKLNFGGSFQHLNIPVMNNHFVVFVNLKTHKDKTGRRAIQGEPDCYIVKSKDLHLIAYNWTAKSGTTGYGFNDKYLWFLKDQDRKSITPNNIDRFRTDHNIQGEIDFAKYRRIIWKLDEFEEHYHTSK